MPTRYEQWPESSAKSRPGEPLGGERIAESRRPQVVLWRVAAVRPNAVVWLEEQLPVWFAGLCRVASLSQ